MLFLFESLIIKRVVEKKRTFFKYAFKCFLFSQTKLFYNRSIALDIFFSKISQELFTLSYKRKQCCSGRAIFFIVLQMLGPPLDSFCNEADLSFCCASVVVTSTTFFDYLS